MSAPWCAEKGVVVAGGDRRVAVCNGNGRPDASIAAELAGIHNQQLEQLRDDIHASALEIDALRARLAQAEETRTAAQTEATRVTLSRREFADGVRKALRMGAGGDVLAAIYRLQRLGDAVRQVVRDEGLRP